MDNKYDDVRATMDIGIAGGQVALNISPNDLDFSTSHDICGFMHYLWNDMNEEEREIFMKDVDIVGASKGKE